MTPSDILPFYAREYTTVEEFEEFLSSHGSCLCAVQVEQVLDRHKVDYSRDPFGWCVSPWEDGVRTRALLQSEATDEGTHL